MPLSSPRMAAKAVSVTSDAAIWSLPKRVAVEQTRQIPRGASHKWAAGPLGPVRGELRSQGGSQMRNDMEIAIVAEAVRLHASNDTHPKTRSKRVSTRHQFIGAIRIFDTSP